MKAIILKGLPASGKSTYAKNTGLPIVSKDTIRLENPGIKEKDVQSIQEAQLYAYATGDRDIVIDNTHMNHHTLEKTQDLCESLGYEVEIHDMLRITIKSRTITPLLLEKYRKICKERNMLIEQRVPESVIDEMFLSNYSFMDPFSKNAVIFDLDGTLAWIEHRLHFLNSTPKNWKAFFDCIPFDQPYEPVVQTLKALKTQGYPIVIMSGRPNTHAFQTEARLKQHNIPYDYILMRSHRDKRPDTEVKLDLYNKCLKDKVAFAFDDRKRLIEMRRSEGIYTFDCGQSGMDF